MDVRFLLVSLEMANTKPLVAVACFCEQLLIEGDNVPSAIRIVDTYKFTVPPEATPVIAVKGLISLKSGDVTGTHIVELILENPLHERKTLSPPGGWPVVLNGGAHGPMIKLDFPLGVRNFGLCWFDVLFDGEVLTRMPLMLQRADSAAKTTEPS